MATAANQPPQVDKSAPALNGNVENMEDSQESSGVMSTLGVRVIQTIIFVYDFVTYPFSTLLILQEQEIICFIY